MSDEMMGKVALVTGGSTGIGRAAALAFASKGAHVVVVADKSVEGGESTVRDIKKLGGDGKFVKSDVSKPSEVASMVDVAVETYGRLDFAFNNAGIEAVQKPIHEYPEDIWNNVLNVNLTGVWLCMKYEIRQMLKNGGGALVNNASVLGISGYPNGSPYVAAKHGVVGITKSVALEYATKGIRINAVCPGFIETDLVKRSGMKENDELYDMVKSLHPMNRLGTPEEVAKATLWLCSDDASFITGHALFVDGGYLAR